ncbi:MAG: GGDEF domain-containing protein [Chloroflexi bacterium]|nr:GGDEF domain-containing protein [Chloroflexota bacterium]
MTSTTAHIDLLELKKNEHSAFVSARLILVSLFIGLWALMFAIRMPMPYGFLIALVTEVAVLVAYGQVAARARDARQMDRYHYGLLAAEVLFHTAMVYYLGGVSWLGAIAYMYAIIYASAFLHPREAVVFTGLVSMAFLTIVSLDGAGVIPHQWYLAQNAERYRDVRFLVTTCIAFTGVLMTVSFWMIRMGSYVRRQRDEALKANVQLSAAEAELRQLNEGLEQKVRERTAALQRMAEMDPLTELLNRGAIARRCQELLTLVRRGARPLTVIIGDVDRFKGCNDRGGHLFGDAVLRGVSRALRASCRSSDLAGRWGGDEFIIVVPDTDCEGAQNLVARFQSRLDEELPLGLGDAAERPTVSFGLASYPDHGSGMEDLIRAADRAMYSAKEQGGGRWEIAPLPAPTAAEKPPVESRYHPA